MSFDRAHRATPIAVAGLSRRADTREAMTASMRKASIDNAFFADDVGAVVDWRDWNDNEIAGFALSAFPWRLAESNNRWWCRDLKLGEIACALTHWRIWTYARDQQLPAIIILEDDVQLLSGFERRDDILSRLGEADPNWDLLYVGRERMEPDRATIGAFAVPGFSYCTYGYALSAKGVQKLLGTDLPASIIPIDEFLPAMYMPHPRPDVRARFTPCLTAYGLLRDIVAAQNESEWGSDTEASPDLPHS